jgi:hypothetical protein
LTSKTNTKGGTVFQKGGGGTNFEQFVQTAFLTTLLVKGNAPCIIANEVTEVAFQTTNFGYVTDDILVRADSSLGQHRLLIQSKHNVSFTSNSIFKELLKGFWQDYNNSEIFDKEKDKLLIVKSDITKEEKNNVKTLFDYAVAKANANDFISEVNRLKGKKERLAFFRLLLKEINNGIDLSDNELWKFLKCLDVLEYDFLNQSSVDQTHFLNLIKLCKNINSKVDEKEIWNSIFTFSVKLNLTGGSVTHESLYNTDLYKYFDTSKFHPLRKEIEKLKSDSQALLIPIKNTINNLHIDRSTILDSIENSLNTFQITFVTGLPGVGKSAEVKEFIEKKFHNSTTLVFRADLFDESTLSKTFSSIGINASIIDIFSCLSLIPTKIIVIDSLEKLLEADPECSFKQLLALLTKYPDIKIIGSSRKYAVDLICQKFGIDPSQVGNVEVPPLNDNELNLITEIFPQLKNVLINTNIKKLLRSPKYLDFSIQALSKSNDDYRNITITEFKDKLWNALVVDFYNTKNGVHIKREKAFMEIAVNRAKEMKLFTSPIEADEHAITLLENDQILFQEKNKRKYAPSHDILEDWALVKYVSGKYEEQSNPKELFASIGNEPAIRRAFRLWI